MGPRDVGGVNAEEQLENGEGIELQQVNIISMKKGTKREEDEQKCREKEFRVKCRKKLKGRSRGWRKYSQ